MFPSLAITNEATTRGTDVPSVGDRPRGGAARSQSVHISVGAATQRSKAALPVYTPQPRQHVALPGLILSVTLVGCVLVHCH